ncbi:MAG: 4Fe-4S dicluster domain-containing protein [Anaerolineae bacterium]
MKTRSHPRAVAFLLPHIWKALARGACTVDYPFGEAEIPPGYRGVVKIKAELCRGCGLCARDCPASALELVRRGRDEFQLIYYPDRCAYCGQCEASCNFGAIYQVNEFVRGTDRPDQLRVVLVDRKPSDEGDEA